MNFSRSLSAKQSRELTKGALYLHVPTFPDIGTTSRIRAFPSCPLASERANHQPSPVTPRPTRRTTTPSRAPLIRHREEESILVPLYLRSAKLPTFLKLHQYIDAREGGAAQLSAAIPRLVEAF